MLPIRTIRHCLWLIFFLVTTVMTQAQGKLHLSGRIVNSINNKPVDYAEVRLLGKDSLLKASVYTSQDGYFQMEANAGSCLLQVRYLGTSFYTHDLAFDRDTSLGAIAVDFSKSEGVVVVAARRKLIERKIDRLSFNVENSVMSDGVDAIQLLKNTPLISVTDFSIGIFGKSNVMVMIDDKIVNMSGQDLINYLKSLRSNDIARIEVITTPPSKYVAEGNSGLLNIVLKKNAQMGWSGSASTSFVQATYAGYANNLTLNYRSNRVHTTVRLREYDRAIRSVENIDLIGQQSLYSHDTRKDMDNGVGANINFLFRLNKVSDIGFIYDLGFLHSDMNISNRSEYMNLNQVDSVLFTTSRHRNPITVQSLNAFYNLKLDTLNRKLSLGFNYFSNAPRPEVDFATTSPNAQVYRVRNTSRIDYSILSGQLDLYLPFKKLVVETGAMFTDFTNNSDVRYLDYHGAELWLDTDRSNLFNYDEKNYALYASASRDFGKKWSVKGGLRYELSAIDGHSVTTGERTQYNYSKLFPTLYLKRNLSDNNTLTLSYAKRINRPVFRALNPFRWYINPFSFYTGNPLLRPSYNHNMELGFLHKNIFSVSLYVQRLVNGFDRIVNFNNGVKEVNYQNYLSEWDFGSNMSLYLNPAKWWELNTDLTGYYSNSASSRPEVVAQNGFSLYYSVDNTFTLNKPKQVFFFINFWNSLPARQGNLSSESLSLLTSGLRFNLFQNRLKVNTSVEDIFRGLVSKGTVYFDQFVQRYNNYYDVRRLNLSLTYSFGNNNVGANSKQIGFTEKNRIN